MNQSQLDGFERWFDEYTNRFLGRDDYVDANLRYKQEHTVRVRAESVFLAEELALREDEARIAELIGLLHDVGRFPQFAKHRTFRDSNSVNHSQLGVQILREEGVLDSLSAQERQWIETAVGLHGRKSLPSALSGRALLFAKIIRDADKIDIYRVVSTAYQQYQDDPDSFRLEIELPDEPGYSPEVLQAVLDEKLVDSSRLRTLNDAKLCQLGWVYDLNFAASMRRINQLGYLAKLFSFLPPDDEMQKAWRKIRNYINTRLT